MAEPRGPRGPKDPTSPDRIAGIPDRRYSQRQREMMEALAEQDRWHEARNAYAPGNRPVIFHQLNPLAVPEKYQDLSEFWTVYVPRTHVAWSRRQIEHDFRRRVGTTALDPDGDWEHPSEDEQKRVAMARRDDARLQQALKDRELAVFGSAEEAERYAQHVWRTHWTRLFSRQSVESRQTFEQKAAINVIRREAFTLDVRDPAHMAQYEVWRAQYPDGLPTGVVVHQRHVDTDAITLPGAVSAGMDDESLDWSEPDRTQWDLIRPAVRPETETPWQIRATDENVWVLAREVTPTRNADGELVGPGWEFWRNGTGRVVAFSAPEPDRVLTMVPRTVPVVVGSDMTGPNSSTLASLWQLERDHDRQVHRHPAVQEWLAAEQSVGETLKEMVAANPEDARRLKPVLDAVVGVHRVVLPSNGVVANNPDQLEDAYDRLTLAVQHTALGGPRRDELVDKVRFWHHKAGPLSQDSLGLFQFGRVPDVAFADPDVEAVARLDGTGDWVAHRTPSGAFMLAKLSPQGRIDRVDLPLYRDAAAVRIRVEGQGGYLTFEQRDAIADQWRRTAERAFGPEEAERKWAHAQTPARTLRHDAYAAAQAADPKPVHQDAVPPTIRTLYVTPIGGGRSVVWQYPDNAQRKEQSPEFVAWKGDQLMALNKHSKGWLAKPKPGDPAPDWGHVPEDKRPWLVSSDGLADAVQQVMSRVPNTHVEPKLLTDASLIRALAERYGVKPEPIERLKDALWVVHPTPKGTVMLSTRQWVAQEKAQHPGEFEVYMAAKPYRVEGPGGDSIIPQWPSAAAAKHELESKRLSHTVASTMPPEVADWFDPKLKRASLAAQAVRWGPVEPWTALTKANRFIRESFAADLRETQAGAKLPRAVRRMQRQIFAGAARGLTADDFDAVLPHVPAETGVTWKDAEAAVHDYARHWLEQRPKLAERLTHPDPAARIERRAPGVSVSF